MSTENAKTLAAYDITAQKYLDNTLAHDAMRPEHAKEKQNRLNQTLAKCFAPLPTNGKILEVGAADGVNSSFLKSAGYNVVASDVAPAFLEALKKCGFDALKFNLLEDEFPSELDGVLAWRVFVHFTREDIQLALNRIYDALNDGGRFVFNVIDRATHDSDEQWVDFNDEYKMGAERYYAYYREEEIREMIAKAGFKLADSWKEEGGHNNWFCFVVEK